MLAGFLIHRTGRYRELIWAGVTLMTLGTGLYIDCWTDTPLAKLVGIEIIGAIGVALLFQTPMIALQNTVSQADTASATASLGFFRNLGTSLSVVVGGVVFQNSMNARHPTLAAADLGASVLAALDGDHAAANVGITSTISNAMQRQVVRDAFAWSLRNMFILYFSVATVIVVASVFVKQQHMQLEHTETKTGIALLTEREQARSNQQIDLP